MIMRLECMLHVPMPMPMVDVADFCEAEAEALTHHEYHRLGAMHARLKADGRLVQQGTRRWAYYTVGL